MSERPGHVSEKTVIPGCVAALARGAPGITDLKEAGASVSDANNAELTAFRSAKQFRLENSGWIRQEKNDGYRA